MRRERSLVTSSEICPVPHKASHQINSSVIKSFVRAPAAGYESSLCSSVLSVNVSLLIATPARDLAAGLAAGVSGEGPGACGL